MRNAVAILLAAGSSSRMGGTVPKVLLPVAGQVVLLRSLATLNDCGLFSRIVVTVPRSFLDGEHSKEFLSLDIPTHVKVVQGGATRALSVQAALKAISDVTESTTLVAIHDAARCAVSKELVRQVVERAAQCGAATAAIPCNDTIVEANQDRRITRNLDRSKLWAVQTPQVFEIQLLRDAHQTGDEYATDDASLVQHLRTVEIVPGERSNIKITTAEDLASVQTLLSAMK